MGDGQAGKAPKFGFGNHRFESRSSRYNPFSMSYPPIAGFMVLSAFIASFILGLSFFVAKLKPDGEKVSAYECGFDPFDDARARFDVRFYLVAILFIIFDLEVTFCFPWALTLFYSGLFGFYSIVFFLGLLTLGFVYE